MKSAQGMDYYWISQRIILPGSINHGYNNLLGKLVGIRGVQHGIGIIISLVNVA
jgi:hypothetical protein